jgi:hypothetical protein
VINWDIEERKQLITLLKSLPELATERSRLQILELAGLKQLAPMLDLSGAPFVAVSEIVSYLSNYGRLTSTTKMTFGGTPNPVKSITPSRMDCSIPIKNWTIPWFNWMENRDASGDGCPYYQETLSAGSE